MPGSVKYVAGKHADCAEIGVNSIKKELPADATFEQIAEVVQELNADPAWHRLHRAVAVAEGHRRERHHRSD